MKIIYTCLFLFWSIAVEAQLKLPKLISDGLVLQRNTALNIWGWASPGDSVTIHFQSEKYGASSDREGGWKVELPKMEAGGPYEMMITTNDSSIVIKNILIGEVWLCSGQSNMQFTMAEARQKYANQITNCENEFVRSFEVPKQYDFSGPQNDLKGGQWVAANPQSILRFSAVAYFFGLELYNKYRVPIGLINASVGGTPAQAWMSEEALKAFPQYYEEAKKHKNLAYVKSVEQKNIQDKMDWDHKVFISDKGIHSEQMPWFSGEVDIRDWPTIHLPGYVTKSDSNYHNGVIWFSRKFKVRKSFADNQGVLRLGRIVDADSVYINGVWVGSTDHQWATREYILPKGALKEGDNRITIRVVNYRGRCGFVQGNQLAIVKQEEKLNLAGEWHYKYGVRSAPLADPVRLQWASTGLYNNMIAPISKFQLKGVIWYQGEGNVSRAKEYADLFPALIKDWREEWQNDDLPFLFVQLANFSKAAKQPQASNWALLREAQQKTLALKNTGMAVAIDIGEWNDIHPKNKQEVGKRLAYAAQRIAYKENNIHSGPIYKFLKIKNGKAIISFELFGAELKLSKGEELEGFAIAGADQKFVWAKAKIEGDKVVVWTDKVKEPVAVRYAWANNPDRANLANSVGLPASPFRTDNWER
jgi:sialate O-acetylesterase